MNKIKNNIPLLAVIFISAVVLLPFLGLTDFNTKGEPREAVVALSMLEKGNWILPINNGGDIPYKPPFFHFCIALLSVLAGYVSEYTSRLPSALALIAMTVGSFCFFAKRKNTGLAFITSMLILTSFEVHRAGVACRVDMMLTAFIVGALYLLYRWQERGSHGLPVLAILCMSGAVMTKGPVGMVLPCMVTGVFMLLRGERFLPTFGKLVFFGLLACVLPALWYVAAYQQGGERFLDLVKEENIGRFTGTMSYDSHNNPAYYNVFTIVSGWLPYTLLLLFSLFVLPWKTYSYKVEPKLWMAKIKSADPLQLFVWLSFLLIFVFYCIPSSKRSVYLLPCYPFMAYLMAEYLMWLIDSGRKRPVKIFIGFMAVLSILMAIIFVAVKMGAVPDSMFHGRHAYENMMMVHALRDLDMNPVRLVLAGLPVVAGVMALRAMMRKEVRDNRNVIVHHTLSLVFLVFIALDGVYLPAILNSKSLYPMSVVIEKNFPKDKLYSYVSVSMMHFFGADFYTGDRIEQFELSKPDCGVLMIPADDSPEFMARHKDYNFKEVLRSHHVVTEMKGDICFYRFSKLPSHLQIKVGL